ncbi:tetratricopeptide repeat protein 17-like [Dreissena polymorpha]|uniref:Tetratricopeptide repeat protein 17 n=1 Tax=Dreissena polymorpha TaxID=45954 RepID=A0A9D4EG80_DREPO|nr:tetratricopeptide repeat protein 17-like [Dreissena polymorpha]KAH3780039.1 hypothetical protein DPMN_157849 [Dreissena polymorpha]
MVDEHVECSVCRRWRSMLNKVPFQTLQRCDYCAMPSESQKQTSKKEAKEHKDELKDNKRVLTCGKPVNFTQYDHLRGIANRSEHPHVPEPEVALMFRKKGSRSSPEVDMTELEIKLRKQKKENPKSPDTLTQIGNYWRIKGNTQFSIECFRKALSISPNSPDILLYLARILFHLQYLDDAIFLTRKSLIMQPNEQDSWHQHFTLGEILKAYGHVKEASMHFEHALELNPGFQRAEAHLRDLKGAPSPSMTQYTLFIILFLIMGVVFGVITSMEANYDEAAEGKPQRHFNRAMAMRSMKLGINPKLIRMRKLNGV